MKDVQSQVKRVLRFYPISNWIESLFQAFMLAHAVSLLFSAYNGNDLSVTKPPVSYLTLFAFSFVIFSLVSGGLHLRTRFLLLSQASIVSWFVLASVISFRTNMPSLIIGLIAISISLIVFKRHFRVVYAFPLALWLGRITYLLNCNQTVIPNGFPERYWKPLIGESTLIALGASIWILLSIAVIYVLSGGQRRKHIRSIPLSVYYSILGAAAVIHFLWFAFFLYCRTYFFTSSTYDMGIFTQMFHGMLKTAQPLTTLERDGLLSHFSVHLSPTLYLLLPLFALVPHPLTLQFAQVLVVGTAVIPFYRLAKHYGFGKKARLLWAALFLLQPGLILSGSYDFHENCLLPAMLLWLIYFISKGKLVPVILFTALTLGIKEDTFIYVLAISLWLFFGSKDRELTAFSPAVARRTAVIMGLLSVLIFILSVNYLRHAGAGAMTGKFNNLQGFPDWGLSGVIATMLLNPMLLLSTIFVAPKLNYILIGLSSMGFIPLLCRRFHLLFLWLPFIVINLLSNWLHQYEINFQYGYGSHTLLLFMALSSVSELSRKKSVLNPKKIDAAGKITKSTNFKQDRYKTVTVAALLTLALTSAFLHSAIYLTAIPKDYLDVFNPPDYIREAHDTLAAIPRDLTVVADGGFTTHLADISELYDMSYYDLSKDRPRPDLLILNRSKLDNYEKLPDFLDLGYQEIDSLSSEYLVVFTRYPTGLTFPPG